MGPGLFFMGGIWIFPLTMIIIALVVVSSIFGRRGSSWRDFNEPSDQSKRQLALEILKERYARGEITREEFEQMKRDILD